MPATSADLDHVRVRFATYREADAGERAKSARQLRGLAADEWLVLDTCHRIELISVDRRQPDGPMVTGTDAVRRVFEVVAGFDSAVIAEEQLLGQVRTAYEAARAEGATGPILDELMQRALRFGRRVRSHALPGADRSLADRGARWLNERLPAASPVVVAGTGEMGMLTARLLADAGHTVTIASRSEERARRAAASLPGDGHDAHAGRLDAVRLRRAAAVVLAVRTREPILTAATLEPGTRPWVLDLSAPPALSTDAARSLGDRVMTLDRLGDLESGRPVLPPRTERRLRRELEDQVGEFVVWLEHRGSADALEILHGEADALRRRHIERLRGRAVLDSDQLAAVDTASAAMIAELLHRPSVELRSGGADADAVRRLFGLGAGR